MQTRNEKKDVAENHRSGQNKESWGCLGVWEGGVGQGPSFGLRERPGYNHKKKKKKKRNPGRKGTEKGGVPEAVGRQKVFEGKNLLSKGFTRRAKGKKEHPALLSRVDERKRIKLLSGVCGGGGDGSRTQNSRSGEKKGIKEETKTGSTPDM